MLQFLWKYLKMTSNTLIHASNPNTHRELKLRIKHIVRSLGLPSISVATALRYFIFPLILYTSLFILLTFPLITYFNTHVLSDSLDALQNIWNFWWFKQAVTSPDLNLWETNYLFHPYGNPYGNSLYNHALMPLMGFFALVLSPVFELEQSYNFLMIASFGLSGLSLFWLAYYWFKAYIPALLAGFWFAFSSFHFAHASSHIEMASLQWLTLYVLALTVFFNRPTVSKAFMAAILLRIVLWNTPYHFLYCVLITGILGSFFAYKRWREGSLSLILKPVIVFGISVLLLTFGQISSMLQQNTIDPMVNTRLAEDYSLELLGYLIPAETWRFNYVTQNFWDQIPGGPEEASTYLGWVVIILMITGLVGKTATRFPTKWHFFVLFLVFTILAMGSLPQWWGIRHYVMLPVGNRFLTLPYDWLESLLPFLKMSELPLRMVAVPNLVAPLLAGLGAKRLLEKKRYVILSMLCVISIIETLPAHWKLIDISKPNYVHVLATSPDGNVFDTTKKAAYSMYYQTVHGKPIANGYLARTSMRTELLQKQLQTALESEDYWQLCQTYAIRYLITDKPLANQPWKYREENSYLYDLADFPACAGSKVTTLE